jgi:hypothetical protein
MLLALDKPVSSARKVKSTRSLQSPSSTSYSDSYSTYLLLGRGNSSTYPYINYTLAVDLKAEKFRVVFTDFRNASTDMVVEATTLQTSYPDGRVVISEGSFSTRIFYNDLNRTNENIYPSWNQKWTNWEDEECSFLKNEMLNDTIH